MMMTSHRAVLLALTTTFAACGGPAPTEEETITAAVTPASTCQTQTDGSGPFKLFKTSLTRRVRHFNQPDRIITIDVAQTSRWFDASSEEQALKVSLNGQPLF